MYRTWQQFLAFMGLFAVPGVLRVVGMEIFTSNEVEALNGTEVRLKCTFKSKHPVSHSSVAVSWNFRPLSQGAEESVFYYQETAYPPTEGRFKGHAVWSGDIMRQDASISLHEVPFTFNGTYTCQVRNLPDVHGINGEVTLRVVHKVSISDIGILAAAIGGTIAIVLVLLGLFMVYKYCNRHANTDMELQGSKLQETRELQERELQANILQEKKLKASEKERVWSAQGLEMSTGKVPFLEALNGSTVLLPCTYASCIGIKNLYFNWQYNDNGTMQKVCESVIPLDGMDPHPVSIYRERVEFIGTGDHNNISILLWNITFEDEGQYTCFGRNPKEKGKNHSAIFTLVVVDELRVVDNTLTIIIASAVGGAIALLMTFMLVKNFILFVLFKIEEKKKIECLVQSSSADETNNVSGSKTSKPTTPKKK